MKRIKTAPKQSPESDFDTLLATLKQRFEKNMNRHRAFKWDKIQEKLIVSPKKLRSLLEMERSGGEPDVVGFDNRSREYIFFDCSPESPSGRRGLCYDKKGWEERKEHRPKGNAVDTAAELGIELLTEEEYRELQGLGEFDTKTSSWLKTPADIRKLGGAIFADRRLEEYSCITIARRLITP